ncbi:rhomboid family intramembrane serine protease [Prosthecobacter sp.]|jgi:membrane associated rhomboid family serine protease|uniref:rhomboid family intramembrane serine protease n=1 Tax=Prosthecobacter sp. TaxID=1965333 RepID=UPI0037851B69
MALSDRDYMRESPRTSVRGVTAFQAAMLLNIGMFVLQHGFHLFGQVWKDGFYPYGGISAEALARGQVWTIFTYAFVHADLWHLLLNLMLLGYAGMGVQKHFGSRHFLAIYLLSAITGAATEMIVNGWARGDTVTPLIGASASAFGLLMALAVMLPGQELTAFIYFIIPVRLRMWTLAKGLFLAQLVVGVAGLFSGVLPEVMQIAYFAHLGGAAAGWFYARSLGYGGRPMTYASQWQPQPALRMRKPELARARRMLRPQLDLEEPDTSPTSGRAAPIETFIEEEVNPILDKISVEGMGSLTDEERRTLERASRLMNRDKQQG